MEVEESKMKKKTWSVILVDSYETEIVAESYTVTDGGLEGPRFLRFCTKGGVVAEFTLPNVMGWYCWDAKR